MPHSLRQQSSTAIVHQILLSGRIKLLRCLSYCLARPGCHRWASGQNQNQQNEGAFCHGAVATRGNPKGASRLNYAHYNLQAKIAEMLSRLASSLAE
jgi:hypothetical protein